MITVVTVVQFVMPLENVQLDVTVVHIVVPFKTVQSAGVGGPLLATALDAPSARTPTTATTQLIPLI